MTVQAAAESRANILMSQAIALRADAERKIAAVIQDLEALTGLTVSAVEVDRDCRLSLSSRPPAVVCVRVEL